MAYPKNFQTSEVLFRRGFILQEIHRTFSQISAPLRELIAKDKTFIWGKEQQDAFDELKNKLCNPPVLRFPDSHREYFLETDASIQGISYILGQRDDESRKYVVSYGGRGLRSCERRWPVTN